MGREGWLVGDGCLFLMGWLRYLWPCGVCWIGVIVNAGYEMVADWVLAYYALPDLPSNTRVHWLKPEEVTLARQRMVEAGRGEDEPVTWGGLKRVLGKWHFWVYTAYYTWVLPCPNVQTLIQTSLPDFSSAVKISAATWTCGWKA